jgi:ubiquinone/menaquinone biosynthesis C-methylase UbiE
VAPWYTPAAAGRGKAYLGRAIADTMGVLGASWLERDERVDEERTDVLVAAILDALGLARDAVVADVGAGSGYFVAALAPRVQRVIASDLQLGMIGLLQARARREGWSNVSIVQATPMDPGLAPASVDLVLFVDAYHEFEYPRELMLAVRRALRPGGRVALVEYRAEDPNVPIKPEHKMTEAQAVRELAFVGLRHVRTDPRLPQQHLMFFEVDPQWDERAAIAGLKAGGE